MRSAEFYEFMRRREAVRMRREAGQPWPWTDDEILRTYKFTNVKRLHDRTTREFAAWYDEHRAAPPYVQLLNCGIARYFGHAPFVIRTLGWQSEFRPEDIKLVARVARAHRVQVFTGAYVITNQGIRAPKEEVVVDHFLAGLWEKAEELCDIASTWRAWQPFVAAMSEIPGFGGTGFMAKEVALDTMLTPSVWPLGCSDLNTWCPAGPGARRGLNRLRGLPLTAGMTEKAALGYMLELFELRGAEWPRGWVELELHDIQFQLCEWDKYERVRLGEGRPRSLYRAPR